MKKAKIALTAIALFAVIGGALAVKATKARFPGSTFYYKNAAAACLPITITSTNWGTTTLTTGPLTIYRAGFYTSSLCTTTLTFPGYPTIEE
jgi:ABC-type proline/glycine betaine transport system substrate-binding protein